MLHYLIIIIIIISPPLLSSLLDYLTGLSCYQKPMGYFARLAFKWGWLGYGRVGFCWWLSHRMIVMWFLDSIKSWIAGCTICVLLWASITFKHRGTEQFSYNIWAVFLKLVVICLMIVFELQYSYTWEQTLVHTSL